MPYDLGRFIEKITGHELDTALPEYRQVGCVLNLIGNAAKYNRDGNFVRLSARPVGAEVEFLVEDDGPGIAEADIPRLFTAFDRLGQQNRSKIEGTGLGLALSKSLVESMGGAIRYTRTETGSRFSFTLPRTGGAIGGEATKNPGAQETTQ